MNVPPLEILDDEVLVGNELLKTGDPGHAVERPKDAHLVVQQEPRNGAGAGVMLSGGKAASPPDQLRSRGKKMPAARERSNDLHGALI
jgi:hypothetical protein